MAEGGGLAMDNGVYGREPLNQDIRCPRRETPRSPIGNHVCRPRTLPERLSDFDMHAEGRSKMDRTWQ